MSIVLVILFALAMVCAGGAAVTGETRAGWLAVMFLAAAFMFGQLAALVTT